MKLLSAVLMAVILFLGTACLEDHNLDKTNKETEETTSQEDQHDPDTGEEPDQPLDQQTKKRMLLTWEVKLSGQMHIIEQPFNRIQSLVGEDKQVKEGWTSPTYRELDKETLNKLVQKAAKSYNQFAETLRNGTVPPKLPDTIKVTMREALNELTTFYEARAKQVNSLDQATTIDELKKKINDVITDTRPNLQSFTYKINQLHNRLNLDETDFVSELSGH
ncbi:MAG TPA: hypothetical protein VFT51_11645 [Bacillales bacterium]|nr:hypothetical protein [Bacillales bacterium]